MLLAQRSAAAAAILSVFLAISGSNTRGDDRSPVPRVVRVALYDDRGIGARSANNVANVLVEHQDLRVERIKAEAIRGGRLADYDVVILPGGGGRKEAETLGEQGRTRIREFVRGGGGYLGVCAGAYLATCDYPWSLHILDAKVVDKAHWARGSGEVPIALTPKASALLQVDSGRPILHYNQGPLLAPANDPDVPDFDSLASFDGEIAKKGAPAGVMKGTTAIASGRFGKGRVLCFSPHPESTKGRGAMIYRGILWASGR